VVQDWVVLNHHRCWIEYSRGELPHLAPRLGEIRRLQAEGRWDEAAAVFPSALKDVNYRCEVADYHPLGEIWIHQHDIAVTRDYRSSLDLQTGEVVVAWTMKERRYTRRLFVSRADDVIALTVNGWEPGALQMACRLRPHRTEEVTDYGSGRRPQPETPPIIWEARQGSGWHAHIGRYEDGTGIRCSTQERVPGRRQHLRRSVLGRRLDRVCKTPESALFWSSVGTANLQTLRFPLA
jgi:alpha-L-fucosidase 2